MKSDYLNNMKSMDSDNRSSHLKSIEKKFEKCKEFSDEKVQLANQTYEMVDKHIRRLDADLARFEAELKDRSQSDTENTSPNEKYNLKHANSLASMIDDTSQNATDLSTCHL